MGIEDKNGNKPDVILSETSAKGFLCLLYNPTSISPGFSPETSIRFADKIDEVIFAKRCCYFTGTANGILKEDLDVAGNITRKLVEELRGKSVLGINYDLSSLRGGAIILLLDVVRESARRLPLEAREEYAGLLNQLPESAISGLMQYKYGLVRVDSPLIQGLVVDFAKFLRKPSRLYP